MSTRPPGTLALCKQNERVFLVFVQDANPQGVLVHDPIDKKKWRADPKTIFSLDKPKSTQQGYPVLALWNDNWHSGTSGWTTELYKAIINSKTSHGYDLRFKNASKTNHVPEEAYIPDLQLSVPAVVDTYLEVFRVQPSQPSPQTMPELVSITTEETVVRGSGVKRSRSQQTPSARSQASSNAPARGDITTSVHVVHDAGSKHSNRIRIKRKHKPVPTKPVDVTLPELQLDLDAIKRDEVLQLQSVEDGKSMETDELSEPSHFISARGLAHNWTQAKQLPVQSGAGDIVVAPYVLPW